MLKIGPECLCKRVGFSQESKGKRLCSGISKAIEIYEIHCVIPGKQLLGQRSSASGALQSAAISGVTYR